MSVIRSSVLAIGEQYALAERNRWSVIAWHSTAGVLQASACNLIGACSDGLSTMIGKSSSVLTRLRKMFPGIVL